MSPVINLKLRHTRMFNAQFRPQEGVTVSKKCQNCHTYTLICRDAGYVDFSIDLPTDLYLEY